MFEDTKGGNQKS